MYNHLGDISALLNNHRYCYRLGEAYYVLQTAQQSCNVQKQGP